MAGKRAKLLIDLSRLITRFSRRTPNGIDRIDLGYAQHALAQHRDGLGIIASTGAPRAIQSSAARDVVDAITHHWRENNSPANDPDYQRLITWLSTGLAASSRSWALPRRRHALGSALSLMRNGRIIGGTGIFPGRNPARHAPTDSIYLNISQFPLWIDGYFRWLDARRDIRPVFFLHDLLPLQYPEFFPPSEAARHGARLSVLAKRAAGVLVSSEATRVGLERYLRDRSERIPPICVNPLPVSRPFCDQPTTDPELAKHRYFVALGTIEPRKNHLLLLHIWREISQTVRDAPKLVIIGANGWDCENVLDMLDRCEAIRSSVASLHHLPTPSLLKVMANADGLLMPTFAEGYGLPVTEALSLGVPVVASEIPAFQQFESDLITKLDPLDGRGWMQRILSLAKLPKRNPIDRHAKRRSAAYSWSAHMDRFEQFVETI